MRTWEIAILCITLILFGIGICINNNNILLLGGLSCFVATPILIRRCFFVALCPYCGKDTPKISKQCDKCNGHLA